MPGQKSSVSRETVLERTEEYVKSVLGDDSTGHDWWHIARVRRLAMEIGEREARKCEVDLYVVELAALLHDISDYKFNGGDLEKGGRTAFEWLSCVGESDHIAQHVAKIIDTTSFKGAGVRSAMSTVEGKIVQDADYLDAVGAIGIGRAFAYGGFKRQPMHDANVTPTLHASQEEYLKRRGTTINHFYEKLLLLKDRMNTETGRALAEKRHEVMVRFLDDFLLEWDAGDL